MTVRESLLEKGKKYYNSQVKRLERLKEISAPQIVIENITKELSVGDEEYANNFLNKINIKKCPTGVLDFEIINEERKIGRGGKPYYYMQTNNGEFNFFPLAQYGAVLFPNEKIKNMNTKTIKSKLDKIGIIKELVELQESFIQHFSFLKDVIMVFDEQDIEVIVVSLSPDYIRQLDKKIQEIASEFDTIRVDMEL